MRKKAWVSRAVGVPVLGTVRNSGSFHGRLHILARMQRFGPIETYKWKLGNDIKKQTSGQKSSGCLASEQTLSEQNAK